MCGHLDAGSSPIFVTEHMYENLVKEVKECQGDFDPRKIQIRVEMVQHPIDSEGLGGDMEVHVHLRKIKMWVKPKVIGLVYEFAIVASQKLD